MAARRHAFRRALERNPIEAFVPLPHQLAVLQDTSRIRLLRTGVQLGKTSCGVVDLLSTATGVHPWNPGAVTREAPECWVICASWLQSITIQKKIWAMVPKDQVHPRTTFDEIRGFGWTAPSFRIRHRPSGGWATVRIKTTRQGPLALASATIPFAWFDEPPSSDRVYSEITKRVMRYGSQGRVLLTMTPVNVRVDWLQDLAEHDKLRDYWYRLEPEIMIPVGHHEPIVLEDGTPCDAAWIAQVRAETLPHEIPVVVDGEWRMTADAPVFSAFRPSGPRAHVTTATPDGDVDLLLGIDHGVRKHTQTAVLLAAQKHGPHWKVWVIDCYESPVETTEDEDADAILTMLERHGQTWSDLKAAFGDRAHTSGKGRFAVALKSNAGLAAALGRSTRAKQHGIRVELNPPIRAAKRGPSNAPGAVRYGCTWLHRAMVRAEHFHVHPRCKPMITAIQGYDGAENSEESHLVDGLRYGLRDVIFGQRAAGRPVTVYVG